MKPARPNPRLGWTVLSFAWIILLLYINSTPGNDLPKTPFLIPHFDKLAHFGWFAILGWMMWRALVQRDAQNRMTMALPNVPLFIIACALITGIVDEVHQIWVPLRSFDPLDLVADMAGASVAVMWMRWRNREKSRSRS